MNKQKQIEEMVKVIGNTWIIDLKAETKAVCEVLDEIDIETIARKLYEQDYRKVPDGAVVLTPEERDEKMKEINKILSERDELKAEIVELKSKIEELKLKCAALQMRNEVGQGISEAANNLIKNMIKVEKEKAVQEFAEKLKTKLFSVFGKTICSDLDTQDIADIIDEVLKEV